MADETVFAQHQGIDWQNETVGVVNYGGDKNMVVFFFNKSVPDTQKSQAKGRPVYRDEVYVRVHPPGERLNIVERPATRQDAFRWANQWNQFQQRKDQTMEGTPIDLLYPGTPSIAATLRANNVYTIEQCAELSGHAIDSVGMGAQAWVNAAVKYLEAANKGVKASTLQRELDERDGQIRVLLQKVEDLTDMVSRLQAANRASFGEAQQAFAGQMPRPQHLPQHPFDPQTAQINANSPTAQVARAQVAKRRRTRPSLTR